MRVRRRLMLASLFVSWLGKRAGVAISGVLPYLLALVLLVVGGWLFYNNAYDRGVEDTEIKYEKIIAQEQRLMRKQTPTL